MQFVNETLEYSRETASMCVGVSLCFIWSAITQKGN